MIHRYHTPTLHIHDTLDQHEIDISAIQRAQAINNDDSTEVTRLARMKLTQVTCTI